MIDFPHVRKNPHCPLCEGDKHPELVVCWPCHRQQVRCFDGRYSEQAITRINRAEQLLKHAGHRTVDLFKGEYESSASEGAAQ
jgi:hypothetical protein